MANDVIGTSQAGPEDSKAVPELVIGEVEVSVNAGCSLACAQCGFFVPKQPRPFSADAVTELAHALHHLGRLGVRIGSMALLGGEANLARLGGHRVRVLTLDLAAPWSAVEASMNELVEPANNPST